MSQTDLNVANASGAVVRADLNDHFQALATNSAGATAPTTTFPHQWWFDESNNDLNQRNAGNTAWVLVARKDGSGWTPYRQAALTGIFSTKNSNVLAKTAAYTVLVADDGKLVDADATTAAFTVTLPTVASAGDGFIISVKKTDSSSNAVTINPSGVETIDGRTTKILVAQFDAIVLRCDGTEWHVVADVELSAHSGSFTRDVSLASGNQGVVGVGFRPKAVIFFANISTTPAMSVGQDDGTIGQAVRDRHAATPDSYTINGAESISMVIGSGLEYSGHITSLDSDGFTIAWVKTGSPTGTATIQYLALR